VSKLTCMVAGAAALAALAFDLTAGYGWAYAIDQGVNGNQALLLLGVSLIAAGSSGVAGGLIGACLD